MHVRTTAEHLACWLERAGGHWVVEGETTLRHLPQPAPAASLAAALRRRAEGLVILAPSEARLAPGTVLAESELALAAHDVGGHDVFQLAWVAPDGSISDSWLVAEHPSMTESGERRLATTQSGDAMVELLRRELKSGETRIKK